MSRGRYKPVGEMSQTELDRVRRLRREAVRRMRERKIAAVKQAEEKKFLLPLQTFPAEAEVAEPRTVIKTPKFYSGQQEFLDLLDTRRFVCLCAGRQYGKSTTGCYACLMRIYGGKCTQGVGWIIAPTYPMSEQLQYRFESIAGPLVLEKRRGNTPVYFLEPAPGMDQPYRVEIKTAENPDRLRGPTLDWVWLDESRNMVPDVWPIIIPTVAVSRGPIMTTTTPAGQDWVYKTFEVPAVEGNPDFGHVRRGSSEANHFNERDLAIMRAQMSEDMAKQELDAEIISFSGLVYTNFNPKIHIVDPVEEIPQGAEVVGGIDFGWDDPFVHLWVMKYKGQYTVFHEFYAHKLTMQQYANGIKTYPNDLRTLRRWSDPSGAQEAAELQTYGVGTYPARNDLKVGIDAVRRLFDQRKLFVARNCIKVLEELAQYHYPEKRDKNTNDIPHDSCNHTMDALRYALFSEENSGTENPYAQVDEHGDLHVYGLPDKRADGRFQNWANISELYKYDTIEDEDEEF